MARASRRQQRRPGRRGATLERLAPTIARSSSPAAAGRAAIRRDSRRCRAWSVRGPACASSLAGVIFEREPQLADAAGAFGPVPARRGQRVEMLLIGEARDGVVGLRPSQARARCVPARAREHRQPRRRDQQLWTSAVMKTVLPARREAGDAEPQGRIAEGRGEIPHAARRDASAIGDAENRRRLPVMSISGWPSLLFWQQILGTREAQQPAVGSLERSPIAGREIDRPSERRLDISWRSSPELVASRSDQALRHLSIEGLCADDQNRFLPFRPCCATHPTDGCRRRNRRPPHRSGLRARFEAGRGRAPGFRRPCCRRTEHEIGDKPHFAHIGADLVAAFLPRSLSCRSRSPRSCFSQLDLAWRKSKRRSIAASLGALIEFGRSRRRGAPISARLNGVV